MNWLGVMGYLRPAVDMNGLSLIQNPVPRQFPAPGGKAGLGSVRQGGAVAALQVEGRDVVALGLAEVFQAAPLRTELFEDRGRRRNGKGARPVNWAANCDGC